MTERLELTESYINEEIAIAVLNEVKGEITTIYENDLKNVMEERQMSVKTLADRVGVNERTIRRMRDKYTLNGYAMDLLEDISDELHCEVDYIALKNRKRELLETYYREITEMFETEREDNIYQLQSYIVFGKEAIEEFNKTGQTPLDRGEVVVKYFTKDGIKEMFETIGAKISDRASKQWIEMMANNHTAFKRMNPYKIHYYWEQPQSDRVLDQLRQARDNGYFAKMVKELTQDAPSLTQKLTDKLNNDLDLILNY